MKVRQSTIMIAHDLNVRQFQKEDYAKMTLMRNLKYGFIITQIWEITPSLEKFLLQLTKS